MPLLADLRVLYHLVFKRVRACDHAARMEQFYAGQSDSYDDFRKRLLPGRQELFSSIPICDGGVWVDLGGGTGANLECLGDSIRRLSRIYVVDLSPSLLEVARRRFERLGWSNVELVEADAITFRPPSPADVVTFSYSLTMIPDWVAAINNARDILRQEGILGAVDFYVSRKHPAQSHTKHSWLTRSLWPLWFACDDVFLSADHVPYLHDSFRSVLYRESRGRLPYVPFARPPYYLFVGRKRG